MQTDSPVQLSENVDLFWVDDLPVIRTPRIIMTIALRDQVGHIVRYLVRNREHLRAWEPSRNEAYYQESSWIGAPGRDQTEAQNGHAYRFRLFERKPGMSLEQIIASEYVGTVSLREIQGWPMHHATLGYSIDHSVEGRGLMREAVEAVIQFAFKQVNLLRIEACYMPNNTRSAKLLESLGFEVEGRLRKSLEVNGQWEDHLICSLLNPNWIKR